MERPNIKDFFNRNIPVELINNILLREKELNNYIEALNNYIEALNNQFKSIIVEDEIDKDEILYRWELESIDRIMDDGDYRERVIFPAMEEYARIYTKKFGE